MTQAGWHAPAFPGCTSAVAYIGADTAQDAEPTGYDKSSCPSTRSDSLPWGSGSSTTSISKPAGNRPTPPVVGLPAVRLPGAVRGYIRRTRQPDRERFRRDDSEEAMTVIEVPSSLAELLTPEWLTAASSSRFPGVEITAVTPGPVVERVSTNARFLIECADPVPPGLPSALCVKGYFRRPVERAAPPASPRRASTATWLPPPGYAPCTACGPTWIRRATASRSPKTSWPTGESSWTR